MWIVEAIAGKSGTSAWRGSVIIAAVFLLAALLAGSSISAWQSARQRAVAEEWRVHTFQVLLETGRVKIASLQAMRGERGYLITGDSTFLAPYRSGRTDMLQGIQRLADLTRDNPTQQRRIVALEKQAAELAERLARMVELKQTGQNTAATRLERAGQGRMAIEGIHATLSRIEAAEQRLLATRELQAVQRERSHNRFIYAMSMVGVLLLALCVWATIAVRRAVQAESRLRRELRQLAMFDELTGLANRREFFAGLDREIASATRTGKPLAVALLDIDHFKQVNDTWGHAAGDAVIRRVAELALATMRGHDIIGRVGGEEYAIVMPGATAHDAVAACERLRASIASEAIDIGGGERLSITASSGVASYIGGITGDALIARADEALYGAKRAGRDRVRLAA